MPPEELSKEDQACLEEYEKIVEFARQVLTGVHPRVKISLHAQDAPSDVGGHAGSSDKGLVHTPDIVETSPAAATVQRVTLVGDQDRVRRLFQVKDVAETTPAAATVQRVTLVGNQDRVRRLFQVKDVAETTPAAAIAQQASLVPIEDRLRHRNSRKAKPFTTSRSNKYPKRKGIDYKRNYYYDLGLKREDRITEHSILSGYRFKERELGPASLHGKQMIMDADPDVRQRFVTKWAAIQKAYEVLGNPETRSNYDANYNGPGKAQMKAWAAKKAAARSGHAQGGPHGRNAVMGGQVLEGAPKAGDVRGAMAARLSRATKPATEMSHGRNTSRPVQNVKIEPAAGVLQNGNTARQFRVTKSKPAAGKSYGRNTAQPGHLIKSEIAARVSQVQTAARSSNVAEHNAGARGLQEVRPDQSTMKIPTGPRVMFGSGRPLVFRTSRRE